MTQPTFLLLTIVFGMGTLLFERGSPAQIIVGICAVVALLLNNGMLPKLEKLLVSELPSISVPATTPPPVISQNSDRQDFVNLILAIQKSENAQYIDPDFLIAVATSESNWKPKAKSSAGAVGIYQLMPATAKRFGVTDRTDPAQSITGGIRYIKWLYNEFNGDYQLVAAAYNAGEGAVKKYGGIPPYNETKIYVKRVIGNMAGFKTLEGDWSMRRPLCRSVDCLYMKSHEAVQGGKSNHGIYALATWMQNYVAGFIYYSAFNDQYHQDKYCSKKENSTVMHCYGLAVDFTAVDGTDIQATLAGIKAFMAPFEGFSIKALSKCNGCTGPHFHAQFDTTINANVFLKFMIKKEHWVSAI